MHVEKFLFALSISGEGSKKIIHRNQCWGVMMMQPWQSGEMPFPCGKDRPAFLCRCKLPNLKKNKKIKIYKPTLGNHFPLSNYLGHPTPAQNSETSFILTHTFHKMAVTSFQNKTKSCCKTSTASGPKNSVKDINLSGGQW